MIERANIAVEQPGDAAIYIHQSDCVAMTGTSRNPAIKYLEHICVRDAEKIEPEKADRLSGAGGGYRSERFDWHTDLQVSMDE